MQWILNANVKVFPLSPSFSLIPIADLLYSDPGV